MIKAKDPRLANHPMCRHAGWEARAIPIAFHGDAVPAVGVGKGHSRSWDAYSWRSILARGPTWNVKQYLTGLFEECKVKADDSNIQDTMQEIWRYLTWSFLAAYEGVFPCRDAHNKRWCPHTQQLELAKQDEPLAGGFFWYCSTSQETSTTSRNLCTCATTNQTTSASSAPPPALLTIRLSSGQTSAPHRHGNTSASRKNSGRPFTLRHTGSSRSFLSCRSGT